jgi:hypothetical protein
MSVLTATFTINIREDYYDAIRSYMTASSTLAVIPQFTLYTQTKTNTVQSNSSMKMAVK